MHVKLIVAGIFLSAILLVIFGLQNQETNLNNVSENIPQFSNLYIKEYSLPDGTSPNAILADKNGYVFVVGSQIHSLFKFLPSTGTFVSSFNIEENNSQNKSGNFPLMSWSIVEDQEGLFWFSQMSSNPIWMFNPTTEKFSSFSAKASPFQLKVDNKDNIWFTTLTANTIGVIQKNNHSSEKYTISEFDLVDDNLPSGIFLENDQIWVSMIGNNQLVKFKIIYDDEMISDLTKILEVPLSENFIYSPTDLLVIDDSVWITEHGTSFISKLDLNSNSITRFSTSQNQYDATTLPFWIRSDSNGDAFWFNEHTGNKIGYFDIKKLELIEYDIPTKPSDGIIVYPLNIAIDKTNPNLLWFSEWNTHKIGVVDKSIPIPFDIRYEKDRRILIDNNSHTANISLELIKSQTESLQTDMSNVITLNASSPIELNSGLGNMTVQFSTSSFDFVDMAEKEEIDVLIQNIPKKSNTTLGISAANGLVSKTIFFELTSK